MRPRRSQPLPLRSDRGSLGRMSAPPSGGGTPIENRRQLIEYFAAGNKPPTAWRMGTEHEKFGFHTATLRPLAYDGPDGIRAMLEGMTRFGWEPVVEGNNPIALQRARASVTLEPGGQFELSGAPLETLHETAADNTQRLHAGKQVPGANGDAMRGVRMYFVSRGGKYIEAGGQNFRDLLKGELPARAGGLPTLNDWADHITAAFPEVRLKRYLEMRGADSGPLPALNALPALWVGLLYDRTALDAAWDLLKGWTVADHDFLRAETPKTGLSTIFRGRSLTEWAREVVEIAHARLRARQRLDGHGHDEPVYLPPLDRALSPALPPPADLLPNSHPTPTGPPP